MSAITIDLITPPSSPKRGDTAEHVDLISSDDEEDVIANLANRPTQRQESCNGLGKRKAEPEANESLLKGSSDNEDEDAAQWRQKREQWKREQSRTVTTVATSASNQPSASARDSATPRLSCEAILKLVETVYPVEAAKPAGLNGTLRPYQAQSLAFMLDVERSTDPLLRKQNGGRDLRGGWLCDEMGMGKTCVVAALMLANPPAQMAAADKKAMLDLCKRNYKATGWATTVNGTRYESSGHAGDLEEPQETMIPMKQHYYDERVSNTAAAIKRGEDKYKTVRKFRWVADPSKSTIPNPEHTKWTAPKVVNFPFTVVLTTNALLGQWQDELKKFAPSLRVQWYYSNVKAAGAKKEDIYPLLKDTDVVLSTHGTGIFSEGRFRNFINIHRLIIDECHTTTSSHRPISGAARSLAERSRNAWGVTGTPISSSMDELGPMAELIGQWSEGLNLNQFYEGRTPMQQLPDVLKRLMIRHTKSQRIGGEVALALPEADCETVWLEMSTAERNVYINAKSRSSYKLSTLIGDLSKAKTFNVENAVSARRQACAGTGMLPKCLQDQMNLTPTGGARRKLKALVEDLEQLREKEPSLHAVVFTMHHDAYDAIVSKLKSANFEVCGFTGGVQADVRHKTIRSFQESAEATTAAGGSKSKKAKVSAKVFVATMSVGHVGITLTAATRVYLMEPCLNPTMEVQAAGRIHRLGQTREVLVKKFCFKNSIDGAIVALHQKIADGSVAIVDNMFPKAALRLLDTDQ